jgi:anti-sigma-K factor RskA
VSLSPDDEGLAAEYALGTLSAEERAAVAARRLGDPELDAAIAAWEQRLAPLAEGLPELAPPPGLFAAIEARLGGEVVDLAVWRARVARWRGAAAAAGALAAVLAFVVATRPTPPHQFVAVLQKSPDEPAFAMTVDVDKLEFSVRPVAAQAPPDKSYELWIIAPSQAPKSLGVIDAATGERSLNENRSAVRNATYAVTVEPKGGSPTGKPSGAPVFYGKLVPVGP